MQWTSHPPDSVVGRWSTNASCVAIAPNYVITTIHQNGTEGLTVTIDSKSYVVDRIWVLPAASCGINPDIRLARLKDANLANYVPLYKKNNECGKYTVIGGFGKGRGEKMLADDGEAYAYQWAPGANDTFRWCSNTIDNVFFDMHINCPNDVILTGDLIQADFAPIPYDGIHPVTQYEGIITQFDSGGGWFIFDDGLWKVAGLSNLVSHNGYGQFRSPVCTETVSPDEFYAMRVSRYAEYIEKIIQEQQMLLQRDFNDDGSVDLLDFQLLSSQLHNAPTGKFDINNDGIIDNNDIQALFHCWLKKY
ncbi:MAG: hypothetical protein JEZ07_17180 [Phycisphaerae bacterium]|nr:hypothetical protein [Phycisphaerae bacterium]